MWGATGYVTVIDEEDAEFQSTPPVWGATGPLCLYLRCFYISIHAPRVGGDIDTDGEDHIYDISIHAPRVGGDEDDITAIKSDYISIHAPRVGGD